MMLHTGLTPKEKDFPYIYKQNNFDVTVNYLYGLPLESSLKYHEVKCYVKKTGVEVPITTESDRWLRNPASGLYGVASRNVC